MRPDSTAPADDNDPGPHCQNRIAQARNSAQTSNAHALVSGTTRREELRDQPVERAVGQASEGLHGQGQ